ncbi:MAG: high frequency lysogenization protein HflD [Venatoribacter sp.]
MSHKNEEQVIALAAVIQVATLVEQLARTGDMNLADAEPLLNALFVQSPEQFYDVYGNPLHLKTGLKHMQSIFGQGSRISPDIARYTVSLLHLEGKLKKQTQMLDELGQGISASKRQLEHFGVLHENTIANLAELYKDTLSKLSFRIQVTGNPTFLQNPKTANRVRALLLAGIRAAILWRQCGGKRWLLVLKRQAYLRHAQQLSGANS